MTTVLSEHELPLGRNHPHQPLPVCGKPDWKRRPDTAGLRQDTYEPDNILGRWLSSKWILLLQSQEIAAFAQHNFRFERQLAKQRSAEFCPGASCTNNRFTNNKRPRSTHVHDIVVAQFSCEDAWTKGSVSANIDTAEEDDKGHTPDYEEKN